MRIVPLLALGLSLQAVAAEPDYAAECDSGKAASCILLSIVGQRSKDPTEKARGEAWFQKGAGLLQSLCDKRDYEACNQLGEVWLVHGDPTRASTAWEAACDLDPIRCVDLADDLANRPKTPNGLPVSLLRRTCAHDQGLGCVGAAILGEEAGESAQQVQDWFAKGLGLLTAACEHTAIPAQKARSCSTLGDLHYFGIQMEADQDEGLAYWARGCLSGEACRTQAALILAQGDRQGSVALLRRACELGDCKFWFETCAELESPHCTPIPGVEVPKPAAPKSAEPGVH